jgi:hypothetical protein
MAKNKLVKAINYEEEFNQEVQKLFLDYLLSDPETFAMPMKTEGFQALNSSKPRQTSP